MVNPTDFHFTTEPSLSYKSDVLNPFPFVPDNLLKSRSRFLFNYLLCFSVEWRSSLSVLGQHLIMGVRFGRPGFPPWILFGFFFPSPDYSLFFFSWMTIFWRRSHVRYFDYFGSPRSFPGHVLNASLPRQASSFSMAAHSETAPSHHFGRPFFHFDRSRMTFFAF